MKPKLSSDFPGDTPNGVLSLLDAMQALRASVLEVQKQCLEQWLPYLPNSEAESSAANLGAYLGLRRQDVRQLQCELANLGLSSLGRSEAHVIPSLDAVVHLLQLMAGDTPAAQTMPRAGWAMVLAGNRLKENTNQLLGKPPKHRWARIMVTFPSEAADDYPFVRDLVLRGMDCARINCAHDDAAAWLRMVQFVRRAEQETGRGCKIMMDLAGPKLRTGPVAPGPAVVRLKPKRDVEGTVVQSASVILDSSGRPGCPAQRDGLGRQNPARLSVPASWLDRMRPGDRLRFTDLRGKPRTLQVLKMLSACEALAVCDKGAYLKPGLELRNGRGRRVLRAIVGPMDALPGEIVLGEGDALLLTRQPLAGEGADLDEGGHILIPAHISCLQPEIFDYLKPGHQVWIDDGHIGAAVESIGDEGALLRIARTRSGGGKLRAEKGLNFPDSHLALPALTAKDLVDLDFAVAHADIIGYSFVQSPQDMDRLMDAMAQRGGETLGIVAKIETRKALQALPEIIVRGSKHPFGVMIARGDLAVEIGYERLAEIQEEILWLCEAAHVPVIWATQVLEGLVKQNLHSRAEFTDAAMAERAECVMLNKGPFVLDAIAVLDNVVARMQAHQMKKTAQLRALHW